MVIKVKLKPENYDTFTELMKSISRRTIPRAVKSKM